MVYGFLDTEGTHEACAPVPSAHHNLHNHVPAIGHDEVPQPRVMTLHHISPVALRLAVVVILPGQERLVVRTQLAVAVIIVNRPFHTVPCADKHVLRKLVHAEVELHVQIVGNQVGKVEILPGLFPERIALPLGGRELVAVVLIVHPLERMGFRAVNHVPARSRFLHAPVNKTHHAVGSLVHLIVHIPFPQVVFHIRFFLCIPSAVCPEGIFRVVELQSAVKVVIHEILVLRFAARQPLEQAQRIGVVQRLEADGQVLLVSCLVGFQIVQRVALAPFLAADGLILAEDRIAVALLVVHVVLAVIGQVFINTLRYEQVARQAVDGRTVIILQPMVFGVTLRGRKQPHLFQSVIDKLRTSGIGGHGRVREVAFGTCQLRAYGVPAQLEEILLAGSYHRILLPAVSVNLPVAQCNRPAACRLLEVETEVLSGIVHGRSTLNTDIYVGKDKVKRPVLSVIETDLPYQLVGLLVVQLGQCIHHVQRVALARNLTAHTARAYQYQDRVPALLHQPHQLLHAHRVPLVQHAVVLIQRAHARFPVGIFQVVAVHDVVVQHLVRGQRLVVDAHTLHVQVGTCRLKFQLALDVKIHLVEPLGSSRLFTVHIETDQRALFIGLHVRIEHVGNADIRTRLELGTHRVFIAQHLSGIHRLGHHTGQELGLFRGHNQPVPVAVVQLPQAGDQLRIRVRHVGRAVFYLKCHAHITNSEAFGFVRLVEGAVPTVSGQGHTCTAGQQQAVLVPAATGTIFVHAPQHVPELHALVTAHPACRVVFRVTSSEGVKHTHGIRCQRGFNVWVRCGVHPHLKHGITARHTIVQRFHVHVRPSVAAGLTALQQVFLHHAAPVGHFHTGRVRIAVIAGIREVPCRELLCLQHRVFPVTLEPRCPVAEHHAGIRCHTAACLQQRNVMHPAHHTGVLMLCVGFHHVRTFLHLRQRDSHVLLLHPAAGRKTKGKGLSAVHTVVDVLLAARTLGRKGDVHVVPVPAVGQSVAHRVSRLQRHGHHGHLGRGRLHQHAALVGSLRLHLHGIGGGILQVGRCVKGVALSGCHTHKLRILELTDHGRTAFHDYAGFQVAVAVHRTATGSTHTHGVFHHKAAAQCQILRGGKSRTAAVRQVDVHHHLVVIRVLGKAHFLRALATLVILLLHRHHILGAVLAVLHIHVRHRTHHRIEHRSGCRRFRLAAHQFLGRGTV